MTVTMSGCKAIFTKYHGPTDCKGSRVSASDGDGNRVVLSWDCALNSEQNHSAAAEELCFRMKWAGNLTGGSYSKGYIFVFTS